MDMRINPMTSQGVGALGQAAMKRPAAGVGAGGQIADSFKNALQSVSAAQDKAAQMQVKVQMGDPSASLEETMLAMQKAQIGFQATLNVRNRMVQAYTDIMNMSV
ncbi:flagellar hook-basal body complex protein FliE [Hydrogenophaga sp.]|uniref:flagellar hook-basal body complex protein FliE n=1 Tax=Hydrogenophaga sp. TaxID=1904254 RepID=UPI0035665176